MPHVAPERRASDPPEADYTPARVGNDEMRFGWGRWSLAVRGPATILAVMILALGAGMLYMNYLTVEAHTEMTRAMLMQTCLSSLTSDEKVALREAAKRDPRAWLDLLHYNCFYLRMPHTRTGRGEHAFPLTTESLASMLLTRRGALSSP